MVRNREEAARIAEQTTHNTVGMCQFVTRGYFDAPSAGDRNGDGFYDAHDGWLSEPISARVLGDRNPPRGVPVTFSNSRRWHRAISVGNGIRSTDMSSDGRYSAGVVSTVTIADIERVMNCDYVGWSKTITGILIPTPPASLVAQFLEGGPRYDLSLLDRAINHGRNGVVKDVRDHIVHQVGRLPQHEQGTRVAKFLAAFHDKRQLRLGLLNAAIKDGRTGIIKDVRARIMRQIYKLPPS